ncbi:hypothetical protein M2387_004947 [Klebsiella sp. BIGb0407]|nr:hypothetical protein [Klebsiella sp. BIGb0407]
MNKKVIINNKKEYTHNTSINPEGTRSIMGIYHFYQFSLVLA